MAILILQLLQTLGFLHHISHAHVEIIIVRLRVVKIQDLDLLATPTALSHTSRCYCVTFPFAAQF